MRQRKGTQQVKPSGSPATKSNQSPSGMVLTIAFVAIGLVVLGLAYFVYLQYTNAIVVQNVQVIFLYNSHSNTCDAMSRVSNVHRTRRKCTH
jgi:cell division septal protein FtsQ